MPAWPDGCYKARWILPVSQPAIEFGELRIIDGRVAEVRTGSRGSSAIDLGDSIILPGLVNAHTHLEFSDLEQPIGKSGMRLPEWISMVVARRTAAVNDGLNVNNSILMGARESSQAGVALLGEIATLHPAASSPILDSEDLTPSIFRFVEVLGLSESRQRACIEWAESMTGSDVGISPHAPYSVPLELMDQCMAISVNRQSTVAMHLAESQEELELIDLGTGGFRDALEAIGVWREGLFPIEGGIEGYLSRLARAPRGLIVHGNYLNDPQIDFLAAHRNLSVVYCPRTHAYFQHDFHPIAKLRKHGIRVALGTDSRASNPDLSVWKEAIWLRQHRTDLSPTAILEMITLEGAEAIGRKEFGRIEVGVPANLNLVRGTKSASNSDQLLESLFDSLLVTADSFFAK